MKKFIHSIAYITTLLSIILLGLFGVKAHADDPAAPIETPTLEYQLTNNNDNIRYISTITGLTDLTLLDHIEVNMNLSKTGKETINSDTQIINKVYTSVSGKNGKDAAADTYYAVYKVNDLLSLREDYAGYTLSTTFTYVYSDGVKDTTVSKEYAIPYSDLTQTIYAAFPAEWLKDISAYMWNDKGNNSWPGIKMTETGYVYNDMLVYSISNPYGYDHIIINGNEKKTVDIEIKNNVSFYEYTGATNSSGCYYVNEHETLIPDDSKIVITFTNNYNWPDLKVYCFGGDPKIENASWPGKNMNYQYTNNESEGQAVYYIILEKNKFDYIIFNSGSVQTVDIPITGSAKYYISGDSGDKKTVGTW